MKKAGCALAGDVFCARSYEEAREIERRAEGRDSTFFLLTVFVRLWRAGANICLQLLVMLVFGRISQQEEPGDIVVYTVGTVGDNVLMLSAIAALKKRYQRARITAIANCDGFSSFPAEQILGNSPYIDRLITLPRHPVMRERLHISADAREAEGLTCDLFVNLSPFGNRGWIGAVVREMIFAKWLRAKHAVGFAMATYSRKHVFDKVQHRFVKNEARRTAEVIGKVGTDPTFGEDLLARDAEAKQRVLRMVSDLPGGSGKPLVVINPGAKLSASHWPAERFGAVAAWLKANYDLLIVVNGTQGEKGICEAVVSASGGCAVDLAGMLSIQELIELLRMSSLLLTNNTGPMTLAAMTGTPMVVIASTRFSPTFYMPVSEKMVWLFSFDENSYSYDDTTSPAKDLLNITVDDVQRAIRDLDPLSEPKTLWCSGG